MFLILMLIGQWVVYQGIQGGAEAQGEFFSGTSAPVVEKNDRGPSAEHVVVNGDDTELVGAKGLQYRRNFGLAHGDVASDLSVGLFPSKGLRLASGRDPP